MAPTAATVNELLNTLGKEDYQTAVSFIQFLAAQRKKEQAENSKSVLHQIQNMFADDKGWDTEQSMIEEMAAFRRERSGL